jgi:hypothetical protein
MVFAIIVCLLMFLSVSEGKIDYEEFCDRFRLAILDEVDEEVDDFDDSIVDPIQMNDDENKEKYRLSFARLIYISIVLKKK